MLAGATNALIEQAAGFAMTAAMPAEPCGNTATIMQAGMFNTSLITRSWTENDCRVFQSHNHNFSMV
jgi:hypothetical protein